MTVDLRGPKTLRELIGASYRAYAAHFTAFFLIALATAPLQMLTAVVVDRIESDETANLVTLPLQIAYTLVFLLATGALIQGAHLVASGSPVDAGAALDAAFARFGQIVSTQFLYAVLVIASVVAFPYTGYRYWQDIQRNEAKNPWTAIGAVIGALLYFSIRWNFTVQDVMLDGRRNWAALDDSAALVKGQWWRTFGIVLVLSLAVLPASIVATSAAYLPVLAAATIGSVALALALPFVIIGQTFLYFDLKARRQADAISAD